VTDGRGRPYALRAHCPIIGLGSGATDGDLPWRERVATRGGGLAKARVTPEWNASRGGADPMAVRVHITVTSGPPAGSDHVQRSVARLFRKGANEDADKLLNLVGRRERPAATSSVPSRRPAGDERRGGLVLDLGWRTPIWRPRPSRTPPGRRGQRGRDDLGDRLSHLRWSGAARLVGHLDRWPATTGSRPRGVAQTRADRIDEMRMPERYVALGVHLSTVTRGRRPRCAARSATLG